MQPHPAHEQCKSNAADHDDPIVVIGGGPGGSTCAHLLAKAGHRVILVERAAFPRFHIGESMLPQSQFILDRLGLSDLVEKGAFRVMKKGGYGHVMKHPRSQSTYTTRMDFWNIPKRYKHDEKWWAYQVERSGFDRALLEAAVRAGVDVRMPAKVTAFEEGARPQVTIVDEKGVAETLRARFVVDASGRHAFLSRRLGHFRPETQFMTSAVFGHFEGVRYDDDDQDGFINVYFIEDGWIWVIPLPDGGTSVGVVQNERVVENWPRQPRDVLEQAIGRYEVLRSRFADATHKGPVRTLKRLPYFSERLVGKGWALCGDAACFVDPIHSSGMHLALKSGAALADAIADELAGRTGALDAYAKAVGTHHRRVRRNVAYYYKCVQFRLLMVNFVLMCGKWNNPWLRRVNAWGFGAYGEHRASMILWWVMAQLGVWAFTAFHAVTRLPRWGKHGQSAPAYPFFIPGPDDATKGAPPSDDSDVTNAHIEPQAHPGDEPPVARA